MLTPSTKPLHVLIATTPSDRQVGLQGPESLRNTDGMLFEYPYPSMAAFWMRHTELDLTIAWFDKSGRILGYMDMEAHSDAPVRAPGLFSYVLEVPAGTVDFSGVNQLRLNKSRRLFEARLASTDEDDGDDDQERIFGDLSDLDSDLQPRSSDSPSTDS